MTMKKATKNCKDYLNETLKDPAEAAAYLNAAIDDGDEKVFLLALRDIAEARGISNVAAKTSLNRENTYRILSEQGNPRLSSLWSLLDALGLKLLVQSKHQQS